MEVYIFWAVLIIVFGIIEGVTAQLVSIWFVAGSVAGLISAVCGAPVALQAAIAVIVCVAALAITRPLVKKYITPKAQPTNADRCIGESAVVIQSIDNLKSTGQVKCGSNIWSARSENGEPISEGSVVTVKKIEGVKLIVSPDNKTEN